ncbi:MAG: hypothetical protein GX786_02455, partial [Clostridiales bacterium]|nr:hypothetical protein [Clostridiales bacterium]
MIKAEKKWRKGKTFWTNHRKWLIPLAISCIALLVSGTIYFMSVQPKMKESLALVSIGSGEQTPSTNIEKNMELSQTFHLDGELSGIQMLPATYGSTIKEALLQTTIYDVTTEEKLICVDTPLPAIYDNKPITMLFDEPVVAKQGKYKVVFEFLELPEEVTLSLWILEKS